MRGERLSWHKLASHLKMSLQRCQQETTSTEFNDWMVYLEMEAQSIKPEYYYWAMIASEIRMHIAKKPELVKIQNFILKFGPKKKEKELTIKEYTKRVQAKFFKLCGYEPKE